MGEVTEWSSGGTPSKDNPRYWSGDIPWISASSLKSSFISDSDIKITEEGLANGSRIAEENSLLILVRGSMLFNRIPIGVVTKKVAFNQDVKSIKINKDVSVLFLFQFLLSVENRLLNQVTGTGIGAGKLDLAELKSLLLHLPTLPEQQKIAAFLSRVDGLLEQLQRQKVLLEAYKKGVMQQLFSRQLRFRNERGEVFGEWEERRLGDVVERVTRKNSENEQNVLTISAQQGLINQKEYFNKSVSANDVRGYYLLHKGDFAYNKSYSKGYPLGAIKRLSRYEKGVVSTLYICFRAKKGVYEPFLEQFFESGQMNKELHKIAQEGARNHGLLNLSVVEFFRDIHVTIPSLPEQQKIATFLQQLDGQIAGVEAQLLQLQAFKRGLLQGMFV